MFTKLRLASILVLFVLLGCMSAPVWTAHGWRPAEAGFGNPALITSGDHRLVWESVRDVVDNYFQIEYEEPIRLTGNVLTKGRLETYPIVGSTLLEPWRHDSANMAAKIESTLQSIRRQAVVEVTPAEGGYWVDVKVFKEMENVIHPERGSVGAATFRYDGTLRRVIDPVGEQEIHKGWIPKGRDSTLEQRILGELLARFGSVSQLNR